MIVDYICNMMEFLQNLIFGIDHPGLALALDPLTIALIGQGVTKGIQGLQQRSKGKGLETEGRDLFDQQVDDFRAGKYDLGLGQGVYDAFTNTQRLAEEAAQRTAEAGQSAVAGAVANTRYGDPRTAFLVPQTAQAAMKSVSDANLQAAQQQAGATMGLAQAEQGIKTANEQARQQLESMMMARGAGMEQQGLGMFQAGTQDMIGGFGDAAGAFAAEKFGDSGGMENYLNFLTGKTAEEGGRVPKYFLGGFLDATGERMAEAAMEGIGRRRAAKGKDTKMFGYTADSFGEEEGGDDDITITVSRGGETNTFEDGGRTMITPGEPSHETNPIHMINNYGEKVGEAMGGELVFDDEATRLIIEALRANDPEALFAIIKRETDQPQFQMDEAENMA